MITDDTRLKADEVRYVMTPAYLAHWRRWYRTLPSWRKRKLLRKYGPMTDEQMAQRSLEMDALLGGQMPRHG